MILSEAWQGKRYAVYGLARSGLATVEALVRSGCEVACWDHKEEARKQASPFAKRVDFEAEGLAGYDSLVVSPGVPINTHPIAALAREAGVEIIGDVELFARARGGLPGHAVVGITGTNGKSTTTALIHHILKEAGVPTSMGGNIGIPILAQDPLPQGGVYVLELSSYQIDLTMSLDCEVAVLLNITPDHLDRYDGSMEKYAASKARLFEMQSGEHFQILRAFEAAQFNLTGLGGIVSLIDDVLDSKFPSLCDQHQFPALLGPHNLDNKFAAIETCDILGLSEQQIREGMASFAGLPHRMERIAVRDGVLFVNDSKATNPASVAPALGSYTNIRWIVGGQAKTDSLNELYPYLPRVKRAYLIGEASDLFEYILKGRKVNTLPCWTIEEAVRCAALDAEEGDTVLLSPACASFDQFRDFEARGDAFRAAVEAL